MKVIVRVVLVVSTLLAMPARAVYLIVWPPAPLLLRERGAVLDGVTLIEPGATRHSGMRLVVDGERIDHVEAASGPANAPFAGMFVPPGLTDMHAYFPPPSLRLPSPLPRLRRIDAGDRPVLPQRGRGMIVRDRRSARCM